MAWQARRGKAWRGVARRGTVGRGTAWQAKATNDGRSFFLD
jgi:hypothetical protein